MLRMSKLADYGIILLIHAVREGANGLLAARTLAESTGVPFPTTVKLLKRLERGGLLVSQRGPQGGYRLARSPDEISIIEIINALEGTPALTQCTANSSKTCELLDTCPARENWTVVNRLVTETLAALTLSAMSKRLTPSGLRRQLSVLPSRVATA